MLHHVLLAAVTALLASAILLLTGSSVWAAFLAYSLIGSVTLLGSAVCSYEWDDELGDI